MLDLILSTESACDIPQEYIDKYNIRIAKVNYQIDGVDFQENNLTCEQVCNLMKEGARCNTSQINEFQAEEYLNGLLTEGKDILHLSFTSQMSGTYRNFVNAAQKINDTSKNKVYVLDTLCQSGGIGVLITELCKRLESFNTIEEVIEFVNQTKQKVAHYFTVDDLRYLSRGGRITSTCAIIGNIIKVKPVLNLDASGKITQLQKVISRKKALQTLASKVDELDKNFETIYISSADSDDDAKSLADSIFEKTKIMPQLISLSPVVTCHSGPGTVALFFIGQNIR